MLGNLASTTPSWVLTAMMVAAAMPASAQASVFTLTASDVVIEPSSPLFTSTSISGTLTLSDAVMPGDSFGSDAVVGLTLNFAGISGTLADIQADIAPGPVQVFGTRSADGSTFSVFDLRFGFPPSTAGCSFVCAGQIIIDSPIGPNDPSNFIAIDDLDGATLSVIDSFIPTFALASGAVPEPATWAMMLVGLGVVGAGLRDRRARSQRRAVVSYS